MEPHKEKPRGLEKVGGEHRYLENSICVTLGP